MGEKSTEQYHAEAAEVGRSIPVIRDYLAERGLTPEEIDEAVAPPKGGWVLNDFKKPELTKLLDELADKGVLATEDSILDAATDVRHAEAEALAGDLEAIRDLLRSEGYSDERVEELTEPPRGGWATSDFRHPELEAELTRIADKYQAEQAASGAQEQEEPASAPPSAGDGTESQYEPVVEATVPPEDEGQAGESDAADTPSTDTTPAVPDEAPTGDEGGSVPADWRPAGLTGTHAVGADLESRLSGTYVEVYLRPDGVYVYADGTPVPPEDQDLYASLDATTDFDDETGGDSGSGDGDGGDSNDGDQDGDDEDSDDQSDEQPADAEAAEPETAETTEEAAEDEPTTEGTPAHDAHHNDPRAAFEFATESPLGREQGERDSDAVESAVSGGLIIPAERGGEVPTEVAGDPADAVDDSATGGHDSDPVDFEYASSGLHIEDLDHLAFKARGGDIDPPDQTGGGPNPDAPDFGSGAPPKGPSAAADVDDDEELVPDGGAEPSVPVADDPFDSIEPVISLADLDLQVVEQFDPDDVDVDAG